MPAHTHTLGTPQAAVVGAGIAGLGAAVALRRAGWRVETFERSRFKNEIGAAITVTPNAAMVLARWGFDFHAAAAAAADAAAPTASNGHSRHNDDGEGIGPAPVPNQATRFATAHDLQEFRRVEYPDLERECGFGSWSFHRVDLHRVLRGMATGVEEGGMGEPVRIRLGSEVEGVDCERGVLRLAGGEEVQKDLVVIADGAHSRLVSDFVGTPAAAALQSVGRSIYRWLVSMDEVMADEELREQFDGELPGFTSWLDPQKRVLWVNYTCRGGEVLNNAVVYDTEAGEGEDDTWHSSASREQVLKTLANFHPTARRIVDMASEDGIRVHRLFKRPPLDSFVRGRAVIVGDAAHVMIPTHAAGGGIAIESAASLEVLLKGVDGADEQAIKERLRLFDELRVPRCNLTMLASNAGPDGLLVPGVEDEIRRYYSGPLPPKDAIPWSDEFREVLFHHDEFDAAEKALDRLRNRPEA